MNETNFDFKSANERRRKRRLISVIGLVLSVIFLVFAGIFVYLAIRTEFLAEIFVIIIIALLMILFGLEVFLTCNSRKKGRCIAGIIISLVLSLCLGWASFMIVQTYGALNIITNPISQVTHIGVFVLSDDEAAGIADAADYTFGILKEMDRENTDSAVEKINSELNKSIKTHEYTGTIDMVNSLFDGNSGAIILNTGYLSLIKETEGYEDIESKIREIKTVEIKEKKDNKGSSEDDAEEEVKEVITVLISGIDSRVGLVEKSRTDVNIIATINTKTKQVLLVSTPRDYFVPLSISNGARDKLTHAGIYGINVCMDTLGMLYDIDIDYYFRVNFSGFEKIIDNIGGITVYSDYDFYSYCSYDEIGKRLHYTVGENKLDGTGALYFARERYAFPTGDRQRGENQMQVIQKVAEKLLSTEMLKNYSALMETVKDSFETTIPYSTISSIVRNQLKKGGEWNIVSYSVDGYGSTEAPYSLGGAYASVMIPNKETVEKAKELIDKVVSGEIVTVSEAGDVSK